MKDIKVNMDIFKIANANKKELDRILAIDDISRLSITIRESSIIGKDGFQYVIIEGPEERMEVARKELSSISEKMDDKEREIVKNYIEKEKEDIYSGLGSIFG